MQLAAVVSVGVLLLTLAGMLLLLVFQRSFSTPFLLGIRTNPHLIYAVIGFVGFGLAGILIGLRRLLLYSLFALVSMIGGQLIGLPLSAALLILGGGIFVSGAYLLVRFLRRYPSAEGENNGGQ